MTRVVKAPEIRRHELLETSLTLFADHGYDDTTVQEIVDAAGVAKGTFYHYFESKVDLLGQVAAWQADALVVPRRPSTGEASRSWTLRSLRELLRHVAGWDASERPAVLRARLRIRYRPENLALRAALTTAAIARLHPEIERVLAQGTRLGLMHVADPDATADVVAAVWRGNSDHLAGLLLRSEAVPAAVADVVDHLRAMECAIERILGMDAGTLRLYDYRKLERALRVALDAEPPAVRLAAVRAGPHGPTDSGGA